MQKTIKQLDSEIRRLQRQRGALKKADRIARGATLGQYLRKMKQGEPDQ